MGYEDVIEPCCGQTPYSGTSLYDRRELRANIIDRLLPYFNGDDLEGMLRYALGIEDFINQAGKEV